MAQMPINGLFPYILFKDESLLIIQKPAGLLSIPDGYKTAATHVSSLLSPEYGKLWIVHRLDRETSGVLLLARSLQAHQELNRQFEHREVQKEYLAIIAGTPDWDSQNIQLPLLINGDRQHRTVVSVQSGKPAQTEFRNLQRFYAACLVQASPHTGYTHQIRAHLAAIGCPILGDTLYGSPKYHTNLSAEALQLLSDPPIQRVALHAFSISFRHPITSELMKIEAPYPLDFLQALERLSAF